VRISALFGPFSTFPRPLEFDNILDSQRGLTGTDGSFVYYCKSLRARGHAVDIFAEGIEATAWEGCRCFPYTTRSPTAPGSGEQYDAVVVWNDVAGLDVFPSTIPRILCMQVNDLKYASRVAIDNVDLFVAPSQALVNHLRILHEHEMVGKRWAVLPNGCDPDAYDLSKKIPGRCIHASSTDRGLHILLQQWPRIKAAVGHASLRIFYHTLQQFLNVLDEPTFNADIREKQRRARIIRDALPRLEKLDVTYEGGVSRNRMADEYSQAELLTYPCDTIRGAYPDDPTWGSEGFGVAVLEGCASGAVPVTTDCDAFGEVYTGACPVIHQEDGWQEKWGNEVIALLKDSEKRQEWIGKGRELAARHAWPVLGELLEKYLLEEIARKKS
jgi:glycosyltransferase involved in cell wall biosynthesis